MTIMYPTQIPTRISKKATSQFSVGVSTVGTPLIAMPVNVNGQEIQTDIYLGVPLEWVSRDSENLKRLIRRLRIQYNRMSIFYGPAGVSHKALCWIIGEPHVCLPPRDKMDPYYHHMWVARSILNAAMKQGLLGVVDKLTPVTERIIAKRNVYLKRASRCISFGLRRQTVWAP